MLMELMPFKREYNREPVKLSITKFKENKKENKNSRFWNRYIVYCIYSIKCRGIYYIFSVSNAALIQGRHLFWNHFF